MNPQQPPPGDFITTLEPMLLILGAVMTVGVGVFMIWLIRHTIKEDRRVRAEEEAMRSQAHNADEQAERGDA
jgi:hypothetical protein